MGMQLAGYWSGLRKVDMATDATLRYVQAERLEGEGLQFAGLAVQTRNERELGRLDGIIVDPRARRVRYFVVDAGGHHRYLMPLCAASLDEEHHALRLVSPDDPQDCFEFDPGAFVEFDDDDVVAAIFGGPRR